MKEPRAKKRFSLTLMLSAVVFAAILLTFAILGVGLFVGQRLGLIDPSLAGRGSMPFFLAVAGASLIIGTLLSMLIARIPLKPVNGIINAMNRLASGDFKTRLSFPDHGSRLAIGRELSESFNKMASELENTELLRSDFVNNFSHEFKTPIVSIRGFAKLLRRGGLDPETTDEYLAIIESESARLSDMATNMLNLTRVENRHILTDVTAFNLSEQLRTCVLLFEDRWTEKALEPEIDLAEYTVEANEELLKQVWVNLIDNAIKFTPEGGTVRVTVEEAGADYAVTVANTGSRIPPESLDRVFRKFYQGDDSHADRGNGIGLAIVKRVAELHGGSVSAASDESGTAFTVRLPKMQSRK